MTKKLLALLTVLIVAVLLVVGICAAETTVYAKLGGTGDGSSVDNPCANLSVAFSKIGEAGGTVVVIGELTVGDAIVVPERAGDITITGMSDGTNEGTLAPYGKFTLEQNTNSNVVTIDLPFKYTDGAEHRFFGGFNSVTFGESFDTVLENGSTFSFYGGVNSEEQEGITELPYDINVYGGTFNVFAGGNYRETILAYVGSVAAEVNITIHGGTFGAVGEYPIDSNNKNYDTFSISGMSILADDAVLTIKDGTFNSPIYAQGRMDTVQSGASQKSTTTASDKKYYAIDGNIDIVIEGGTFNGGSVGAYYTQAAYTQVMRGIYTVDVKGGTFAEGTVFDATQVKAYEGGEGRAVITYADGISIETKRFDYVNGAEITDNVEPIRVAFIGDSITEGYVATAAGVSRLFDGYPAQFLAAAEEAGYDVVVSNYGIGSAGFLPSTARYYEDMLAWPMVSEETAPDYVFFAMGTNDAAAAGGTNGALLHFEEQYTRFVKTMGDLPDTDKVFVTNAIYRKTSSLQGDLRASAVIHPLQKRVCAALADVEPDKYTFVDLYGLTLGNAEDGSLFIADNGTTYETLHPAQSGLEAMGKACFNAAFNGVTAPESYKSTEIYVSADGSVFGAGTVDDPISFMPVAIDKIATGGEATIYIMGEYTLKPDTGSSIANMYVPLDVKRVTIAGYGDGAKLIVSGNTLKLGSDSKIENIELSSTYSGGLAIFGCYNDVEIADTVTTSGSVQFYAGNNIFGDVDRAENTAYDDVESASSANDCTIVINGGTYNQLLFGNIRFASAAPFGVYSGTMNATIGANVTVGTSGYYGMVGHNYNQGTVNVTVNKWADGVVIPEYSAHGSIASPVVHNAAQNTGDVNITLGEGVTATVAVTGDFNDDGKVTVADVLQTLRYVLSGFDTAKKIHFYGKTSVTISDALGVLKNITE